MRASPATRFQGRVTRWNDARGFGFIVRNDGADDVFAHISDFAGRGRRPANGDIVTYGIAMRGGRAQASGIECVTSPARVRAPTPRSSHPVGRLAVAAVLAAALIGLAHTRGLWPVVERTVTDAVSAATVSTSSPRSAPLHAVAREAGGEFSCAGKTRCSQMTSCEEATFHLRKCPNTQIDGDGDGVPCERQWCNE